MRFSPLVALATLPLLLSACGGGGGNPLASPPTIDGSSTPVTKVVTQDLLTGKGEAISGSDYVTVQYVGANHQTGEVFDSSWKAGKPASFSLDLLIPGFKEGMVGMKAGGRRQIDIPSALGYGAAGQPPAVGPNEDLTFVVDLLSFSPLRSAPTVTSHPGPPPSALKIENLIVGQGPKAGPKSTVTVHYAGADWSTGKIFDSSWDRGEPSSFTLTGVVPGFSEGITGMQVGGRRAISIPSALGYGEAGQPPAISPNEPLFFIVDLVAVSNSTTSP
jgi:peptidylprolyl isomerase